MKLEKHGIVLDMELVDEGPTDRYPEYRKERWRCIRCGWSTESFADARGATASYESAIHRQQQREAAIYHAERCKP